MLDETAIQADVEPTDPSVEHADETGTPAGASTEHVDALDGRAADTADDEQSDSLDAKQTVLKRILAAHETWYDVQRDYAYAGRVFPGFAEFHQHGEQYVLVKRAKLWEVDSHEYIFFTLADRLCESEFDDLVAFMKTDALAKVDPKPDHMTSFLSLVIVADAVDDGLEKKIRKTHFRKDFMLGIRGWADLRLAVVDLSSKRVMTNSFGKEMQKGLESLIEPKEEE